MEKNGPKKQISKKVLKVWRIRNGIWTLLFWAFAISILFLVNYFHLSIWWTVPGIIISFIHTAVFVFITPHIRWKRWRYEIREKEIELSCGVFIIKRTLVPMVRVQHVDTIQGPLLRKFGLASIAVSTAANVHRIPAIDIHEAEKVRYSIAVLARMEEEDV
jgi:membrane protein YdbS with pleckstrin-like domain